MEAFLGGGDGLLVGVPDRTPGVGVTDRTLGVGVADRALGVGLERDAEDGLPLVNALFPERGDGLKRFGLALPLLLL